MECHAACGLRGCVNKRMTESATMLSGTPMSERLEEGIHQWFTQELRSMCSDSGGSSSKRVRFALDFQDSIHDSPVGGRAPFQYPTPDPRATVQSKGSSYFFSGHGYEHPEVETSLLQCVQSLNANNEWIWSNQRQGRTRQHKMCLMSCASGSDSSTDESELGDHFELIQLMPFRRIEGNNISYRCVDQKYTYGITTSTNIKAPTGEISTDTFLEYSGYNATNESKYIQDHDYPSL